MESTPTPELNNVNKVLDPEAIVVEPSRFKPIKRLGHGGGGEVWEVLDTSDNRHYALKKAFAYGDLANLPNALKRFKQELEVASRISRNSLNTDNEDTKNLVITYPELYVWDNSYCYLMEYVKGISLNLLLEDENLQKEDKLEYVEIVSIILQMLDGISVLHKHTIWHRDIKLENIIYREDGRIKICDFGMIKETGAEALTIRGEKFGTAWYIPPEYLKKGIFDQRSDIYACGMILYELLKGERRFPHDNYGAGEIAKRLRKHLVNKSNGEVRAKKYPPTDYYMKDYGTRIAFHLLERKFRHPSIKLAKEQQYLSDIAVRAMSYSPQDRFKSAQKMKTAILSKERNTNNKIKLPDLENPLVKLIAVAAGTTVISFVLIAVLLTIAN